MALTDNNLAAATGTAAGLVAFLSDAEELPSERTNLISQEYLADLAEMSTEFRGLVVDV